MTTVIPKKVQDEIQFGITHAPIWAGAAAEVGLSTATCTAITAAVDAAKKAYDDAQSAREASKAATTNLGNAMAALHPLLADAVKTIRLFAESTNNPDVYTKAQIPPPTAPTPAPPPMQPVQLGAQIIPGGVLRITFKATDTGGGATTYLVSRKLAGQSSYTVIGTGGTARSTDGANLPRGFKFFDDTSLPAGSNNMMYMVVGQRGRVLGMPSQALTVTVGVGGDGQTEVKELKIAA